MTVANQMSDMQSYTGMLGAPHRIDLVSKVSSMTPRSVEVLSALLAGLSCLFQVIQTSHGSVDSNMSKSNFPQELVYDHDGGWYTDKKSLIATEGVCNIEIRDGSLKQHEFLERYAYTAPVIIRGATDNTVFRKMCSKDEMVEEFGDKVIRLSSANTYSYRKVDVTLKKYVEEILQPQTLDSLGNETLYWFGDNNYTEWEPLFDKYTQPPYRLPGLVGVYSFGLAGAGTGVPFHFHGPGFGEVLYGRKRWFLYPPSHQPDFHPDQSTLHWYIQDYPKLSGPNMPYECTIYPGDVIYFPDHWWHATLNIDTSVFISTFLG